MKFPFEKARKGSNQAEPSHRYKWLWEPLMDDATFLLRPMFGSKSVYLESKMLFCFCTKGEPWRGVLVCTERSKHSALLAEFPGLVVHPIISKWLYLPEADDQFERTAQRLIQLARRRDSRIGVVPPPKKRKARK
jgi:hypothetical protein